jgi:hypothetical protein
LSIFALQIGPKGCKLASLNPKPFDGILFSALGPLQGHKVQRFISTWGILKSFFLFQPWTPSVKPLGLISTFAPIGMLDLG